jgi:hypothetical protein
VTLSTATRACSPGPPGPPTTPAGWDRRACKDFLGFYLDLETDTPHDLKVLLPAAQKVLADAIHAAPYGSGPLFDYANDLVADVGSSSWTSQGNIFSRPIQRMEKACPSADYG